MVHFNVTPKKAAELRARMAACGLCEEDFDEHFITAGGPGGQKTNRTATCVCLTHRPTGLEVKMQKSRSQALNRFYARRRLCELIEGDQSPPAQKHRRIRKQKKRRERRSRATPPQ